MPDYQPGWPPPDGSTQVPPTDYGAQDPPAAGWSPVSSYWDDEIYKDFMEELSTSAAGPSSHGVAHYSQLQPPAPAPAPAPAPTEQRESVRTRKYDEWLATPKDKRPLPDREVIAGFAERTLNIYVALGKTGEGHVRAFETAEGIPLGTLKRCVAGKSRSVTGIDLQEGKVWQPGTYTAPKYLDPRTLTCIAMMHGNKGPKEAFEFWEGLAPHRQPAGSAPDLQPAPSLKIVLGWANKPTVSRKILGEFADKHTIPQGNVHSTLDNDRRVASVTVNPWPPRTYGVPSQPQQPTNTVTAGYTNLSYGNTPSLSQAGEPSPPAAARQSSGSVLGPRHGR